MSFAEVALLGNEALLLTDGVVDEKERVERVAEVAAGLSIHAAGLELLLEVLEEVGGGDADGAG